MSSTFLWICDRKSVKEKIFRWENSIHELYSSLTRTKRFVNVVDLSSLWPCSSPWSPRFQSIPSTRLARPSSRVGPRPSKGRLLDSRNSNGNITWCIYLSSPTFGWVDFTHKSEQLLLLPPRRTLPPQSRWNRLRPFRVSSRWKERLGMAEVREMSSWNQNQNGTHGGPSLATFSPWLDMPWVLATFGN